MGMGKLEIGDAARIMLDTARSAGGGPEARLNRDPGLSSP